jgi:hypothetical protein
MAQMNADKGRMPEETLNFLTTDITDGHRYQRWRRMDGGG